MDASEFCFVCGTEGFFPAEDNLLCPDCTRVHAVAQPVDDEPYFGEETDAMFVDGFWENFDAQFETDASAKRKWSDYDYDPFFDMGEDFYFPEDGDGGDDGDSN